MSTFTIKTARALGMPALLTMLALALPAPAGAQSTVTPVQAQTPTTPQAAPAKPSAKSAHTARRRGGVEARIADLHTRLKITADEEAQWKQVADIMRQNAADVEAAVKERSQNATSMSAMDNLRSYEKIAKTHQDGIEKLIPAFQTLYDSMPDAQKKNADAVFRSFGQRRHRPAAKKHTG